MTLLRRPSPTALLARLIETPDLADRLRALPPAAFSDLLRQVGVEDAGEIVGLATKEQLVTAFDEDLFGNLAPGEREQFAPSRLAVWLEVLLEAEDAAVAARMTELSEDFVIHALSSLVMVLDNEALLARLAEGDRDALLADKAPESSLSEEIDGYLLIAKVQKGWDAALALVLALDHRSFLERILDRCSALASEYIDDLDALTTALSSAVSLADDVEGEREARRAGRAGAAIGRVAARRSSGGCRSESRAAANRRRPSVPSRERPARRHRLAAVVGRDPRVLRGARRGPRQTRPQPTDLGSPTISGDRETIVAKTPYCRVSVLGPAAFGGEFASRYVRAAG